jgi:hypothetical protein
VLDQLHGIFRAALFECDGSEEKRGLIVIGFRGEHSSIQGRRMGVSPGALVLSR